MGTSVLTPTLRYNPSIVAQAFGTLGALAPGRVFLGVGTGESLNETPATGGEFPGAKERRRRLAESVQLIERLWREERVDFEGEYYEARGATIYDKPDDPVPIFIAASGPLAAKLAGRRGDGFISTSGKDPDLYRELIANLAEGAEKAERDPNEIRKMIEIKVSYDRDVEVAFESCKLWSALGLSHDQKAGIDDPIEMERVADENAHKAHERFIVSDEPDEVIEKIMPYVDLGFEDLVLHAPGDDQKRFLDQFAADVLPALREEAEKRAKSAEQPGA
jgi:coenzyme F420-dependent glucose-6-phosphate dehydrogenase